MNVAVECFRCGRAQWHATGRFERNRRGLRRAECICDACGYTFFSGRPIAMDAALVALGDVDAVAPPTPTMEPLPRLKPPPASSEPFTTPGVLAEAWIKKRGSEGDGA